MSNLYWCKMKKYSIFISVFVLFIILNMILAPQIYLVATMEGINLWASKVVPSVVVFMFFVKIFFSFSSSTKTSSLAQMLSKKIWNCPGISLRIFFCSILSGYPVGSMMISDQYSQGCITRTQAIRMCSFCSTSGPMFILGAVGLSMFESAKFGYIILISHIIGAFLNGFFYKKVTLPELEKHHINIKQRKIDFASIVNSTFSSVLSIGVIISVFFVIITFFQPIIGIFPSPLNSIFEGIIEITKGCQSISQNLWGPTALLSATFIVSFGGFSTILQSITLLGKIQIPFKLIILQKLTHGLLSTAISLFLFFIV